MSGIALGLGLSLSLGAGEGVGLPSLPEGFAFALDDYDQPYLTDDGDYYILEIG